MSLDLAFKRLSLRPSSLCHQCRRTFASSTAKRQQQSATGAFAESLQAARTQSATRTPARTTPTTTASTPNPPPETTTASRPGPAAAQRTSYEIARSTIQEISGAAARRDEEERQRNMAMQYQPKDYDAQSPRRWKAGDVYAPHDLSGVETAKWKKIRRKGAGTGKVQWDVMDQLGMDPREHYKNFTIMSEYMTDMGRIKHRNETGLRPVNQRRMAKAIRRATGMGLMPGVHRHPEILRIEQAQRNGNARSGR